MINNVRLPPLSILGAVVPRLNSILTLEAGIFIENTPNVNFTDNFRALGEIAGPVVIVGNPQLTSLDGGSTLGPPPPGWGALTWQGRDCLHISSALI